MEEVRDDSGAVTSLGADVLSTSAILTVLFWIGIFFGRFGIGVKNRRKPNDLEDRISEDSIEGNEVGITKRWYKLRYLHSFSSRYRDRLDDPFLVTGTLDDVLLIPPRPHDRNLFLV
uniref:Uncharacterized protein n=1 Tax=Fagus sylvatica TaxID=28930 RepID=A0A2N9IJM3_FAGSY